MKKSEFHTPLVQSGALLFTLLLFFFFVTSSEADGLGTGLLAIASGVFHSILFTIGLLFSIVFSIAILIVLFLASVALYSLDKAKYLAVQLQVTLEQIFSSLSNEISLRKSRFLNTHKSQTSRIRQLEEELRDLKEQNRSLQYSLSKLEKEFEHHQVVNNSTNEKQ